VNYDTTEQRVTIFIYWAQWEKTLYGPIGKALAHNRICFSFAKVLFSFLNFTCTSFKKKFKDEVHV
jgi:hypothetical protein